jgi:large subunit ribosomal protein L22
VAAVEQRQTVRANAKYVRSSARKARLVTDLIRGRSVPEARTILAFSPRAVAKDVEKVLRSAVANAQENLRWDGDDLVIVRVTADEGPTLKRHKPRARGRVNAIMKRTCHITVELAQSPQAAARAAAEAAAPKRTRAPKKAAAETPVAETTDVEATETEEGTE